MHPQPSPHPEPGNRSPAFQAGSGIYTRGAGQGIQPQPRRQVPACRERDVRRTPQPNRPPIEPSGTLVCKLLSGRENPYAMENFSTLIENSKRAVRYWWLLLIIGIALFVVGILVFVYPTQSYLGMSLLFGWLMLISGILEVVLSSVNKHFITGRGWMLAGGIIEIVLGIILIFNVALSAATLPIFLGFWLMLRAFGAIGLGSDMGAMQIAGSGWTIFSGILLLLCSLWTFSSRSYSHHGRHRMGRHFAALCRGRRLLALAPAPPAHRCLGDR